MTREEAIKIWKRDAGKLREPGDIIDSFAELGMLKLDEPQSVAAKLWEIYTTGHSTNADDLMKEIEEASLRIVEK